MQTEIGKLQKAKRVVVYGPEGIGKSTFASQFPSALFIDVEGSTDELEVARTKPRPTSWTMLLSQVNDIRKNPDQCDTLVIDTADWAERLCKNHICDSKQLDGIEGMGYGKGYVYLEEEFGRLLNTLRDISDAGTNIVLACHASLRKIEQPDELGSYDHWELKLEKKVAALIKEWATTILFANFKIHVVNVDNQGAQKGKNKAQGGKRMMYTSHHPCWDAKNRNGLADELPFDFAQIAHIIPFRVSKYSAGINENERQKPAEVQQEQLDIQPEESSTETSSEKNAAAQTAPRGFESTDEQMPPEFEKPSDPTERLPRELSDLMKTDKVTIEEIQAAVAGKGYYPLDTPVMNYDPKFVSGVLVAAWPQVFNMVKEIRKSQPF